MVSIHWFRQDLRLADNPALTKAAKRGRVLPVYILDDKNAGANAMGAASRWWLHHSLTALNDSLGGNLSVYRGDPSDILTGLAARFDVEAVYWNRCYEPWRTKRDTAIEKHLDVPVETANGSLLWEPWDVKKDDGAPYRVFTPFYRKGCLHAAAPRKPLPVPKNAAYLHDKKGALQIKALNLAPNTELNRRLEPHWRIGEAAAQKRLRAFIRTGLKLYKDGRDRPAAPYVSRLSPHLHFGEISPNRIWHAARRLGHDMHIDHFCSELGWREFSHSLLHYNPDLPHKNLQTKFDAFPWGGDARLLEAWKTGQTGVPMVDAGMRELWQTGYMHNRSRMVVGSFLVKNLRLHWRHGERWFWETLVDADLADNSANWQWIAGCGADAAPYFRIFNPVMQGQKFDPDGGYVRAFIPEIAKLPNKYLFSPWDAPAAVLQKASIKLGDTYPAPIVDLKQSREAALAAFQALSRDV